jgi:23S rRNA pseudouridine1911/1915/1917 synthase
MTAASARNNTDRSQTDVAPTRTGRGSRAAARQGDGGSDGRPRGPLPRRLVYHVTVAVAAIWVVLDQATKLLAERGLPPPPDRVDLGLLDLRLVYNENAAFGIPLFPGLVVAVAAIVLFLIARSLPRTNRLSLAMAYGLVAGGAVGNLLDRSFRPPYFPSGAVVDFIDLRWWPVFNLADAGIVAGAGLVALYLVKEERDEQAAERARAAHQSVRPDRTLPGRVRRPMPPSTGAATAAGLLLDRVVEGADDGRRVDTAVAAWLGEPRARVQQRLSAGQVTVGGQVVAKSRRLRRAERVQVHPSPAAAPVKPPPPVPVRYEDDHLLVVAKPAGMVVHAGSGVHEGTLVDALRAMGIPLADTGDPDRPGIVHRLDRGTSGLLAVAKTDDARRALVDLLKARAVEREYWVLVEGVPEPPRATVEAPIARAATHRSRFAVDPSGRPAVSQYDVEEPLGRASVCRVRLETGRTHQVRVHMAAVGHPVVADRAYGASPRLAAELGLKRPALHARVLGFAHPVTGRPVRVEEPLPDDLAEALRRLAAAAHEK